MFVRIINTEKGYLVQDEIDRIFGYIDEIVFFDCILDDEPQIIYEEEFWKVDKEMILKFCKKC